MKKLITQLIRIVDEVLYLYTKWRDFHNEEKEDANSLQYKSFINFLIAHIDWERFANNIGRTMDKLRNLGTIRFMGDEHDWDEIKREIEREMSKVLETIRRSTTPRFTQLVSILLNIFDDLDEIIYITKENLITSVGFVLRLISFEERNDV